MTVLSFLLASVLALVVASILFLLCKEAAGICRALRDSRPFVS